MATRTNGISAIASVWTWGGNDFGQLGDGTLTSHSTPKRVTGLPLYIAGISAGGGFAARLGDGVSATGGFATVLGTDGTVWAWGDDSAGQLGNARSSIPVTRPVNTIGAGSGITQLSAGDFHVLALKSNGTALAWGSNGSGQLGNGSTTDAAAGTGHRPGQRDAGGRGRTVQPRGPYRAVSPRVIAARRWSGCLTAVVPVGLPGTQVSPGLRLGRMAVMSPISRGFRRRRQDPAGIAGRVPPGQYATKDFPVLSAGPTPHTALDHWSFSIARGGQQKTWSWAEFRALPSQDVTVDIHCVTRWSKLDTAWQGVSVDTLLDLAGNDGPFAMAHCDGGYTTNLPVADLTGGKAWVAYAYDGQPLAPEHGGPARLLVPHLYFWKSAKWVRSLELLDTNEPGFWENYGYHIYGDPWREQRYAGD